MAAAQQAVTADVQQLIPIDPWYRCGGGHGAPALAVGSVGRDLSADPLGSGRCSS